MLAMIDNCTEAVRMIVEEPERGELYEQNISTFFFLKIRAPAW
jgi:hypothetical protein